MSDPIIILSPTDLLRNSRSGINQNFLTLYSLVTAGIGISGYSGYSGTSGYSGYSGTSGYSGYSGYSGQSGYSGYSGYSGQSGYSGAIKVPITQSSHGFSVGDVIRVNGPGIFAKAQANNAYNAEAAGIVTEVLSLSSFVYTQYGLTTSGVPSVSAGSVLFLSDTTPGLITVNEPTAVGYVSKPMAIVIESGSKMSVLNMRGLVIGSSSTFSQITINNSNSPYSINGNDCYIDIDASSAPVTAILPSAVNASGKFYKVKKIDTTYNPVTVLTVLNQTIDGENGVIINAPWTSINLHSNNINWLID